MISNVNTYTELGILFLPEAVLVAGALLVLIADALIGKGKDAAMRQALACGIAMWAVVLAAGGVLVGLKAGAMGPVFGGVFENDATGIFTRFGVLLLGFLAVGTFAAGKVRRNAAEFTAVMLMGMCGLTLMGVTANLLAAFLALELASLSLYVLVGFEKSERASAEAGLKYFLAGGVSSAFLLFGFSLLYGFTGTLETQGIAIALSQRDGFDPLLAMAVVMILAAFGFKAAAAPFHLWAPDAYEGAPAPAAALVASASKLAGFVFFARLLWPYLDKLDAALPLNVWMPVVSLVAVLSMLLGNVVAVVQGNVRRILAYSAIGHAGVLLLAVMLVGREGTGLLYYYALTYGVATVGAFGVLSVLERSGKAQRLEDLNGLSERSPFLGFVLMVFVLSLAGIPPLAGFFAKFSVFAAALGVGGLKDPAGRLALLAIVMSAVGLYYYLRILKHALVTKADAGSEKVEVPVAGVIALGFAAALVVVLGVWPEAVLGLFR